MSFDLYIWKGPVVSDGQEADRLLSQHFDSTGRSAFEPSDDLMTFYRELGAVVSHLDALGDQTDRLITLNLLWGTDDAVLAGIAALTAKYQLVLYDPQAGRVHPPTEDGAAPTLPPGEANPAWWRRLIGMER